MSASSKTPIKQYRSVRRSWPGEDSAVEVEINEYSDGEECPYAVEVTREQKGVTEERTAGRYESLDKARRMLGSVKASIDGPETDIDKIVDRALEQT